ATIASPRALTARHCRWLSRHWIRAFTCPRLASVPWMRTTIAALSCSLAVACASGVRGSGPVDERPSCSERVDQSKPSGKLASQVPLPSSRIVLTASVDKPQLLREIASHIPETLATAKRRPIGTPGEVSYTVTRGSVDSSIADGAFHVTTLANASIEICKPVGPFCVTYGRCQPVLATTVSLP